MAGLSRENAIRWMPLDLMDDKSTQVQVMAWCNQATRANYLSQCWPKFMPYGVIRPQWVQNFSYPGNHYPVVTDVTSQHIPNIYQDIWRYKWKCSYGLIQCFFNCMKNHTTHNDNEKLSRWKLLYLPRLRETLITNLSDKLILAQTRYVDSTLTSEVTWSLSATFLHPTMVTQRPWSWSWMINSHPFRSMSIRSPIPEIRLFQTLTLKLQGQNHGYGQRARSAQYLIDLLPFRSTSIR